MGGLFYFVNRGDQESDELTLVSTQQFESPPNVAPQMNKAKSVDTRQVMESDKKELSFNENLRLVDDTEMKELSFQDIDEIEETFEQVEDSWSQTMKDFFLTELGLGVEAYNRYQDLRDEYDVAKLQAYEDYHERMIELHGSDYAYQASQQIEEFENTVLPEFYNKLEAELGLDALRRYIQIKDEFNDNLRQSLPPGPGQILVDF